MALSSREIEELSNELAGTTVVIKKELPIGEILPAGVYEAIVTEIGMYGYEEDNQMSFTYSITEEGQYKDVCSYKWCNFNTSFGFKNLKETLITSFDLEDEEENKFFEMWNNGELDSVLLKKAVPVKMEIKHVTSKKDNQVYANIKRVEKIEN